MSTRRKGKPSSAQVIAAQRLVEARERSAFSQKFVIARKQLLGKAAAENIELLCLIHFDTVKRNQCGEVGRDFLCFNIMTAALIGTDAKLPTLEKIALDAYNAVYGANARDPELLRLTTKEYNLVRLLFRHFFQMLPNLQTGFVADCARAAEREFNRERMGMAA